MGRWNAVAVGLIAVCACGEPGACEETVVVDSVGYGYCFQVEHEGQCPVFESGDRSGEYRWKFNPGAACKKLGYPFDCGGGIWEDLESACASEDPT